MKPGTTNPGIRVVSQSSDDSKSSDDLIIQKINDTNKMDSPLIFLIRG